MDIRAEDLGKKYGRNWVFRHLNFTVELGTKTAITGANGSGKSTLLQILSGYLTPTKGLVSTTGGKHLEDLKITFIAPYSEVIEEFNLREFLTFHARFRKPLVPFEEMAQRAILPLDKLIGEFSTGMKQRVKLITCFFFENDLIFMDEPTSNLDQKGIDWWREELKRKSNETVIIASNQQTEIALCSKTITL